MAAPTPSTRGTPAGFRIPDGWVSKISFARNTTVGLWEVGVQPAAMAVPTIDISTMHNVRRKTKAPGGLIEDGDLEVSAAYDPSQIEDIEELVGIPGSITQLWPDGTTKTFFGFLGAWKPEKLEAAKFPMAAATIVQTNYDPVARVEAAPVWANASGT